MDYVRQYRYLIISPSSKNQLRHKRSRLNVRRWWQHWLVRCYGKDYIALQRSVVLTIKSFQLILRCLRKDGAFVRVKRRHACVLFCRRCWGHHVVFRGKIVCFVRLFISWLSTFLLRNESQNFHQTYTQTCQRFIRGGIVLTSTRQAALLHCVQNCDQVSKMTESLLYGDVDTSAANVWIICLKRFIWYYSRYQCIP